MNEPRTTQGVKRFFILSQSAAEEKVATSFTHSTEGEKRNSASDLFYCTSQSRRDHKAPDFIHKTRKSFFHGALRPPERRRFIKLSCFARAILLFPDRRSLFDELLSPVISIGRMVIKREFSPRAIDLVEKLRVLRID